jgi:hypothetical protein
MVVVAVTLLPISIACRSPAIQQAAVCASQHPNFAQLRVTPGFRREAGKSWACASFAPFARLSSPWFSGNIGVLSCARVTPEYP